LITPRSGSTTNSLVDHRKKVSAVLYGPPATSKTSLARAVAAALGWGVLTIRTSEFLRWGEDQASARAGYIFTRLRHLRNVVIIFDEIEEFVRERSTAPTPFSRLLTTTMLPLIQLLHENRDIIFIVTTNYLEAFDEAVRRQGRFDLILLVGPPSLEGKIEMMDRMIDDRPSGSRVKDPKVREVIMELVRAFNKSCIEYFLYDEWNEFLAWFISRCESTDQKIESVFNDTLRLMEQNIRLSGERRTKFDQSKQYSAIY
jgi:SpoVK/Ycf46/Vps4 family AAA+-type ATPase